MLSNYNNVNNTENSDSIMSKLSESDSEIHEIFQDFSLKKSGYEFYFIIDADEIDEYCFPFKNNEDKNTNRVTDEQFILEYLFNYHQRNNIFLDEYIEELHGTRVFLSSSVNLAYLRTTYEKYSQELFEWYNEIKELINNDEEVNVDDYLDKIVNAYSFLVSISNNKFRNDLRKFQKIMSNNFSFEGRIKNNQVSELFKNIKINPKLLDSLKEDCNEKSRSRIFDLRALLKTYSLNQEAAKRNEKKIFYFISSRTNDIKNLKKKIIKNEYKNDLFKLKNVDSIIRTKSQLFAFLVYELISDTQETTIKKTLDKLDHKFAVGKLLNNRNYSREELLTDLLRKKRDMEKVENLTIFLNFQKEKKNYVLQDNKDILFEIKNFRDLIKKGNHKDLLKSEDKVIKIITDAGKKLKELDLSTILEQIKINVKISKDVELVQKFIDFVIIEKDNLKFDRGDDPVESIFSSLPTLYNYPFFKDDILPFLEKINSEYINSKELYEIVKKIIFVDEDSYIISVLYLLLMFKYKDEKTNFSSNFIVYNYTSKLLTDVKKKDAIYSDSKLADIYAISCWAARRSRKYLFAYNISKEAAEKYPDDPRFYFSLALIGYCWKYEYNRLNRYEWSYKNQYSTNGMNNTVINYCELAIEKLKKKKHNFSHIEFYASLLNLTIYAYIYKFNRISYSREKDYNRIEDYKLSLKKARTYLFKLKAIYKITSREDKHIQFKIFPEYLHTEAFLEFNEMKVNGVNKEIKRYAIEDIKTAIENLQDREGVKQKYLNLLSDLENL